MKKHKTALVFGAGSFGTSIASLAANNFEHVLLKVRSDDVYLPIVEKKENSVYLPGFPLPHNVSAFKHWEELGELKNSVELMISGLPTAGIKTFFNNEKKQIVHFLKKNIPLVALSKGIDSETLEMSDDLFFDLFSEYRELFTFLSGPSFAREIMDEQITLVTLAGRSRYVLEQVSSMLETSYFKALPSYDIKGVLLGGALKNILAIAGGVIEGLGYTSNTRAAMITRGIAEMLRFGKVFNARPETFYGLSGMGDLILTTTGDLSRNKSFGLELAKGRSPEEIIQSQREVVEGYKTSKAAHLLGEKYGIRTSIFNGVYDVLYQGQKPDVVIKRLMRTPTRFELD